MARNQRDREALAQLVMRAQAGDRAAFEELYRRTAQAQFYLIAAKIGYEAAADVLQEQYLIVWRNIQDVKPTAVLGYLGSVGRNLCRQHLERISGPRRTVPLDADALEGADDAPDEVATALYDTSVDPANVVTAADERARLARALRDELTDFERTCVVMRYYQGAKIDEIAEALESSRNTVKRTLSRALLTLRTKMGLAPWGALGLSGALADAVESRMAAGARALERRRPWLSLATGAVGAATVGVTAGAIAFAVMAPPAAPAPEPESVTIEEAAVPAASSAEIDTAAPHLESVRVEDNLTVLRFTDESGVRDVWCVGADGTEHRAVSHEPHPSDPPCSTWRFDLATGTYEAHALDNEGNEAVGEITTEIYPADPAPWQPEA